MLREVRTMGRGPFENSNRELMLFRSLTAAQPHLDINIGRAALGRIFVINIGRNKWKACNTLVSPF